MKRVVFLARTILFGFSSSFKSFQDLIYCFDCLLLLIHFSNYIFQDDDMKIRLKASLLIC